CEVVEVQRCRVTAHEDLAAARRPRRLHVDDLDMVEAAGFRPSYGFHRFLRLDPPRASARAAVRTDASTRARAEVGVELWRNARHRVSLCRNTERPYISVDERQSLRTCRTG